MKKMFVIGAAVVTAISMSAAPASAKKMKQHHMTSGKSGGYTSGNAAMQGNNGNSGQGSNAVGRVKGGNAGGQ